MKFEFYINHNYIDKNQISENENELNWFEISSFGCNIVARWLNQHREEKHGSRSKHTKKKFKGKCWQELIRFLRLRSQFSFFFFKKSIFTCLTLNMPRQIQIFNSTKNNHSSYSTSVDFLSLILSGFNFQPPYWERLCCKMHIGPSV